MFTIKFDYQALQDTIDRTANAEQATFGAITTIQALAPHLRFAAVPLAKEANVSPTKTRNIISGGDTDAVTPAEACRLLLALQKRAEANQFEDSSADPAGTVQS